MIKCKYKIIFAVLITAALTFFLTREFTPGYEVVRSSSDTTSITTEKIIPTKTTYSIEQVGDIKKALKDSLQKVYGSIIDGLLSRKTTVEQQETPPGLPFIKGEEKEVEQIRNDSDFVYYSEIDSNIVIKDSSGTVTDSMKVKAVFLSAIPLAPNSIHLFNIEHTFFSKEIKTETTITDSIFVEKKEGFLERLELSPGIGPGYGLITKQFDIFAGLIIKYRFDFVSLFTSRK